MLADVSNLVCKTTALLHVKFYLFIYLLDFLAFSYGKDDTMRQHRCTETTSTGKTVWAAKASDHFGRTSNHTLEVEISCRSQSFFQSILGLQHSFMSLKFCV